MSILDKEGPTPAVNDGVSIYNGHVTGYKYDSSSFPELTWKEKAQADYFHKWAISVDSATGKNKEKKKQQTTATQNLPGFSRGQLRNAGFNANARALASAGAEVTTAAFETELALAKFSFLAWT